MDFGTQLPRLEQRSSWESSKNLSNAILIIFIFMLGMTINVYNSLTILYACYCCVVISGIVKINLCDNILPLSPFLLVMR